MSREHLGVITLHNFTYVFTSTIKGSYPACLEGLVIFLQWVVQIWRPGNISFEFIDE
jgi:hypothetical protein